MSKYLLTTSAVAAMLAGLAFSSLDTATAADLAYKPSEPVAPAAAAYDWTGPYIGLHAGYGWGRESDNQSRLFQPANNTGGGGGGNNGGGGGGNGEGGGNNGGGGGGNGDGCCNNGGGGGGNADKFDMDGFVGGAHAGYNYQFPSSFVLGVEGDIDYADLKGSAHASYTNGIQPRTLEMKSEWQGSARLRAGYAIDNLLIYATGGIAFAEGKLTNSGSVGDFFVIPTTDSSKTHIGWTAGLGAEYAFTQNWIGRAEVRYTDFQKKTYQTYDGPVKAGWHQVTGTLGLSYKF